VGTTSSETSVLLSSGSEATKLTVLVNRGNDPVDPGITSDGFVGGVDKDDFIIFVGGILKLTFRILKQTLQKKKQGQGGKEGKGTWTIQ
jgi:hypothetical protein